MMKQCCAICNGCEENTCIPHSRGYEAHVSYPFSSGESCKDFDRDEEREAHFESLSEEEMTEVRRNSVCRIEDM